MSDYVARQVRQLYAHMKESSGKISVFQAACDRQANGSDYGLYAAAAAFDLALEGSQNLGRKYVASVMRSHLEVCLTSGKVLQFPGRRGRSLGHRELTLV